MPIYIKEIPPKYTCSSSNTLVFVKDNMLLEQKLYHMLSTQNVDSPHVTLNMKVLEAVVYMCLLACSLFANKYVLSVLGFQFPMVFQGWQTLVGCLTFKVSILALPGVKCLKLLNLACVLLGAYILFYSLIIQVLSVLGTDDLTNC